MSGKKIKRTLYFSMDSDGPSPIARKIKYSGIKLVRFT